MRDTTLTNGATDTGAWALYLKWLIGMLGALLLTAVGMVALANPYGNLPIAPLGRHVIMDDNQRYQYPAIIRSGRFDSLVIGTSTSRLLAPAELGAVLGGTFANLALNSGTPWEQWQTALLFRRTVPAPGTLLVGLDHVWCDPAADRNRITPRGFPVWMYDDVKWNDLAYMLNTRTIEIAGRRIGHALGRVKARWPDDGFEVFVPPEATYDLARARLHIWGPGGPRLITGLEHFPPTVNRLVRENALVVDSGAFPPDPGQVASARVPVFTATDNIRAAWRYPALDWLADILADRAAWRRIVMVMTPVHVASQPIPGSEAAAREGECKARIRALARRHGVAFIDFRIPSPITATDDNYWDPLHFRVPVASRIVTAIGSALASGRDDRQGQYLVVSPESPNR